MSKTSNMFEFVTHTCNRVGGICSYACSYCWAKTYAKRFQWDKYKGEPKYCPDAVMNKITKKGTIVESDFHLESGSFVFEGTMRDLMAPEVKTEWLIDILASIGQTEESKFLILTKNPHRFLDLLKIGVTLPENLILGATIETNYNIPKYSKAPIRSHRFYAMHRLKKFTKNQLFISIEPILNFDHSSLIMELLFLKNRLFGVAIGYDNYKCRLEEPPLLKTQELIRHLKRWEWLQVFTKTLRKAWFEED